MNTSVRKRRALQPRTQRGVEGKKPHTGPRPLMPRGARRAETKHYNTPSRTQGNQAAHEATIPGGRHQYQPGPGSPEGKSEWEGGATIHTSTRGANRQPTQGKTQRQCTPQLWGLTRRHATDLQRVRFSDSDWAAHNRHRRSVSSGIICFHGCLLLPTSHTQRIALSSAEAEVHAAVSTTCDGLLLRTCFEFCAREKVRLKIILDNSAAKWVLLRSGVGRIRHLSAGCYAFNNLWNRNSWKFVQFQQRRTLQTLARYLMHGVGVFLRTLLRLSLVSATDALSMSPMPSSMFEKPRPHGFHFACFQLWFFSAFCHSSCNDAATACFGERTGAWSWCECFAWDHFAYLFLQ